MSIVCIFLFLEIHYLHLMTDQPELYNNLKSLVAAVLIIPFISIACRIDLLVNKKVLANPAVIHLTTQQCELIWQGKEVSKITTIPVKQLLLDHPDSFAEMVGSMLREAKQPELTLKPLLIVHSMLELTKLEVKELERLLMGIGAAKVVVVDEPEQIETAIKATILPDLFGDA
ncbi:conserved hypothetical protein [Vibrio crassostreae]|nr:conserved hypothetical protein [Vibrio crassostreae]CAK3047826.1 conserved hypothetical protein [Vibrio crassostreae]CAK3583405.1 conserved hypothetical protein [Vibrio crassostreae]CAK3985815.1 conserved hypothetical protein [Vibrio crassostreae]